MSRDKMWAVGDRVQRSEWVDRKEVIHTGAITGVETETREKHRYDPYGGYGRGSQKSETELVMKSISVKWDDGTEQTGLSPWHVQTEDTEFEREFRLKAPAILDLINEKLAIADKAIDEAVAIAEEHGISFSAGVSPLGQSYIAGSAADKWPEVSKEFMNGITEAYGEYDGWQHSQVCY